MDFPPDIIFYIGLMLDLPDIIKYCQSSKKFNKLICKNKHFWIQRLKNDYDIIYKNIYPLDPRKFYEFYKYHNINYLRELFNKGEYKLLLEKLDEINKLITPHENYKHHITIQIAEYNRSMLSIVRDLYIKNILGLQHGGVRIGSMRTLMKSLTDYTYENSYLNATFNRDLSVL